jgi:acyl-CoA synthetase (AMP-forming)/AMP-acid ligase II
VPKENKSDMEVKEIKYLLSKKLVSYMIPEIIILNSIPLLTNGKTDRQQLLEFYKTSYKIGKKIIY